MADELNKDQRPVFAVSNGADGVATMVMGIPDAAWEYCKDGKTLTIDLTSVGLPFRILAFGGRTHESVKATLLEYRTKSGNRRDPIDMTHQTDQFDIKDGGHNLKDLKNKVFR